MLFHCAACDVDCTVDDESVQTANCPSCGRLLLSGSESAANEVTWGKSLRSHDPLEIPSDTTRVWRGADAREFLEESRLPCRLGRYEIYKLLARGGFAHVYLARDQEIGREVALKLPRADRATDRERMATVLAEARLAGRLKHAGIATVYDVGDLMTGVPFISMEYLSGGTLRESLARPDLSVGRLIEIVAQVADALQYAHQNGLVHRDLKPGNILIDEFGQPKIVDFGLAVEEIRQSELRGDISGTPAYMSPEQIRGEAHRLDGRTDIWALGVILYETLCGRRPFQGERDRVFDEILNREPKPPRQIDDSIPLELEQICLKCLAKSPTGRFSNCRDVATALREWLAANSTDASPEVTPRSNSGPRRFATLLAAGPSTSSRRFVPAASSHRRPPLWRWLALTTALLGAGVFLMSGVVPLGIGAAPDRQWKAGRWYDLLDRRPEAILWTLIAPNSQWHWNPENHQTLVSSDHPAGLQTGTTPTDSFRIELRFSPGSATGVSGLFWGAHEAPGGDGVPGTDFQVLVFQRFPPGGGDLFRLARELNTTRTPPGGPAPLMDRSQLIATAIDGPKEPQQTLQILVLQGRLAEVRWNGRIMEGLADGPHIAPTRPLVGSGGCGLYNEGGTTIFHEMRIELVDAPPVNPSPKH